jgi:hypothetical protein
MIKTLLLALFCLILGSAWSQTEQVNIIKINPLSLIMNTGSFFYEHKIDDGSSWQLGLAYMAGNNIGIEKYTGLIFTPEYRIYYNKNTLSGYYLAPFLRYTNLKLEKEFDSSAKLSAFGGGVVFGRQWVYYKGFVMDLFAGPIYNSANIHDAIGASTFNDPGLGLNGLSIRFGLSLGFGF